MNAGANGVETRERVVELRALDRKGNIQTLSNAEMGYAYRHSSAAFRADLHLGRLRRFFRGQGGDQGGDGCGAEPPRDRAADPRKDRRLDLQESRGTSAWKEIDKAGCRGLMIGGAQMSPMHCNFMINTGTATGYDLEYLGETVRTRVLENSGIRCSGKSSASAISGRAMLSRSFLGSYFSTVEVQVMHELQRDQK